MVPGRPRGLPSLKDTTRASADRKFIRRSLPGRPAGMRDELNGWNASVWPDADLFFGGEDDAILTRRYAGEERRALVTEEANAMRAGGGEEEEEEDDADGKDREEQQ